MQITTTGKLIGIENQTSESFKMFSGCKRIHSVGILYAIKELDLKPNSIHNNEITLLFCLPYLNPSRAGVDNASLSASFSYCFGTLSQ